MKKIKIFICLLLCIFFFQYYTEAYGSTVDHLNKSKETILSEKNVDLFEYILNDTYAAVQECGVMVVFNSYSPGEKAVNGVFQKLLKYKRIVGKISKNKDGYYLKFSGSNIDGYIDSIKYENKNVITVNIVEKSDHYDLHNLKSMVKGCLPHSEEFKYYQYVKAKMAMRSVTDVNNKVKYILNSIGASDMKTVSLNGGYSSTVNTHMFDPIQSDGSLVDFNYSVVKHSSGTYIIMGTPEIMTTY